MAKNDECDILTRSQLNAGDEYFDLTCTRCTKKKRKRQSVKYCATCKQYFCKECLKIHDEFHSSAGHALVDTDSKILSTRRSGRNNKIVPTEMCKEHPMEVVNMYCEDDNSVGCSICFVQHHRSCNGINYIPKFVQENNPIRQIRNIHKQLPKAAINIDILTADCEKQNIDLEKSKAYCKKEINEYRQDINCIINQIEKRTLAELETNYDSCKQSNENQNMKIQVMKSDLKRYQDDIDSEEVNLAQKFVLAIMGQGLIKQSSEMKSRSEESPTSSIKFSRNTGIMLFLLNIFTLGMSRASDYQETVKTSPSSKKTRQPTSVTTTTTSTTTPTGATGGKIVTEHATDVRQKSKKPGLYKIKNQIKINMKQLNDMKTCSIFSSCITDTGDIVLDDWANKTLKLVDSKSYNIKSSLFLDAEPWSVCRVNNEEIAVCLNNRTIQFVSTCDKLVVTRSLSVKHRCRCITFSRDRMYICDERSLYIYNMDRTLIKVITPIKSFGTIFSDIYGIAISDDHNMIHIVDLGSGVITLTTEGENCWVYSDERLSGAHGVCTDGSGNVIVCGCKSRNVLQLDDKGSCLGEIVKRQVGLYSPQTVCYDKSNQNLIVGICDDRHIRVYALQ
ncbi:hypothetical protein ACF0H5_015331 [Mactra antiquata]